ncbi:glycosyltransferase family 4 protein [Devosia sp.]|uniref:glycosyltransferase family 4 protein n=1 Tax=Devosia sp. TaxID=1871048 RepID=UPI001AD55A1C|nr:glycosyltransferase family 4 protein [Devosia sp.]MBN9310467.1 glycosyltransferase family 4 protein [Devosia sp.]
MNLHQKTPSLFFHDYGGHAFTAQLARAMSRRGYAVTYASSNEFGTPKGRVQGRETDPEQFRAIGISVGERFDKQNLVKRQRQQARYATVAAEAMRRARPGLVVSSNAPLEVQKRLLDACNATGAGFVFWMQDIHSEAIARILSRRSPTLGWLAGRYYERLEKGLLARSDAVVTIADEFVDLVGARGWGLDADRISVIENWAPLEDLPPCRRDNDWARRHFRLERRNIVYSGTLARKHDPEILVRLAQELDADVHLFSEGAGAEHVEQRRKELKLGNLFVRSWVTVDELPLMLAGADVLTAFIEKDAGAFSVPSKVLSYLSAGRPILASIPAGNLATRTIRGADAGLVSEPGDHESMIENARRLIDNPALRQRLGANGRAYAERTFDIERIAGRFEEVFARVGSGARPFHLRTADQTPDDAN